MHNRLRRVLAKHRIAAFDFDFRDGAVGENCGVQAHLSFETSIFQNRRILRFDHRNHFAVRSFRRVLRVNRRRHGEDDEEYRCNGAGENAAAQLGRSWAGGMKTFVHEATRK